jgi:hypothetical protein
MARREVDWYRVLGLWCSGAFKGCECDYKMNVYIADLV